MSSNAKPDRYADAHVNPQGAGDARPTAIQIIKDENLEGKLTGKVMVITGVSAGIGIETVRALATTGATLFLAARDLKKAESALAGVLEPGRVSLVKMDSSSFASIRTAVAEILEKSKNQVNILVGNAGVMGIQTLTHTEDGYETTFATNHLSHFLLFQLLKTSLLQSSTPDFPSRVVLVSSSSHRSQTLSPSDNYNFEKGDYTYQSAYANSKLAVTYTANGIESRYGKQGLHATSVHPGGIATEISRHIGPEFVQAILDNKEIAKVLKSPAQGAATTVLAAVGREFKDQGGLYLEDCRRAGPGVDDGNEFGMGYVPQTYDAENEARLWRDSFKMVGVEDDLVGSA